MFNKILSLMKEGWMRKTAVIIVIALFVVLLSVGVYAEEVKTRVDPEKFKKLTPEQKKEFAERAKEARDTALGYVRDNDEVAKEAEKAKNTCQEVYRTAIQIEVGVATGGVAGATAVGAAKVADIIVDKVINEK